MSCNLSHKDDNKNLSSTIKPIISPCKSDLLNSSTPEEAEPYIKHNNSNFVKDTWVGYKFNRFLNFDSHIWHGVEDYNSNTDEERLTMVTFVDAITVDNKPITRMRQIQK